MCMHLQGSALCDVTAGVENTRWSQLTRRPLSPFSKPPPTSTFSHHGAVEVSIECQKVIAPFHLPEKKKLSSAPFLRTAVHRVVGYNHPRSQWRPFETHTLWLSGKFGVAASPALPFATGNASLPPLFRDVYELAGGRRRLSPARSFPRARLAAGRGFVVCSRAVA